MGGIHGDQLGAAAQRLAIERPAPGLVAVPGRAVDPARAVAAGASGVDGGAGGKRLQLGRARGAVRHGQVAQQAGVQDEVAGVRQGGAGGEGGCGALGRVSSAACPKS